MPATAAFQVTRRINPLDNAEAQHRRQPGDEAPAEGPSVIWKLRRLSAAKRRMARPAQGPLAGLIRLSSRQSASCSGGHRKDICSVEPWNCGDAVTWTIAAASCALDHPALQSLIRLSKRR